jgi:hypothetical protein
MMQPKKHRNLLIYYLSLEMKQLLKGLRNLPLLKRLTKIRNTDGDQSDTKIQADSKLKGTILSIRDLPLKTFINGVCYGSELPNFDDLVCEYYSIRNDPHSKQYVLIVSAMKAMQFRAQIIDNICRCIVVAYHDSFAQILRDEYPQFAFTEDSYVQDLEYVPRIENNNKIQFDKLKAQLDKLMEGSEKEATPESKYKGFISRIFDINENAKYQCISLDSSSTYDFAIALERLEKHIEYLEAQAQKNKQ